MLYKYYKLCKRNIPEKDHVARYIKPMCYDGKVLCTGFQYKKDPKDGELKEKDLSVNWLEFFNNNASIQDNVENVREAFRNKNYTLKKNGRFAVLNIKAMCSVVKTGTAEYEELVSLIAKHTPPNKDDLSHSSIIGIPFDTEGELLVSTILSNYVNETELFSGISC